MTDETKNDILTRFNGIPDITGEISHEEMIELFQHLVDTNEIKSMDREIKAHVAAWAEEGSIKGVDEASIKEWLGF